MKEFVGNVIGKTYKFDIKKIVSNRIKTREGIPDNYFCSELVAAAYINMGLLSEKIPAYKYWPGNFEHKRKLNLIEAILSHEILIDVNL